MRVGSLLPELVQPVDRLLGLLQQNSQRRVVVGLVGLPGSGKSTMAAQWADAVNAALGADVAQPLGMAASISPKLS